MSVHFLCSIWTRHDMYSCVFFFKDTATTEIYTLSLHDALPISTTRPDCAGEMPIAPTRSSPRSCRRDRKSTRLNSSHVEISYAVFFLKKKNNMVEQGPALVPRADRAPRAAPHLSA